MTTSECGQEKQSISSINEIAEDKNSCEDNSANSVVKQEQIKNNKESLSKNTTKAEDTFDINIKEEVTSEATEDESMAVEALWQLGGGAFNEKKKCKEKSVEKEVEPEPIPYPVITSTFSLQQCENCSFRCGTETEYQTHLSICDNHRRNFLTCGICSATFDTKDKLVNHLICHEVNRPFSCRWCGTLFKTKNELQLHVCLHKQRGLQCNLCNIEFSRISSLTNHLKIHAYIPGRAVILPGACVEETILSEVESNNWTHDGHPLPPLLPQLDMQSGSYYNQNNSDMTNWNLTSHLGLNDSIEHADIPDSMDIGQEMTVNTTYASVLDNHSSQFQNEFDSLNSVSINSESLVYDSHMIMSKKDKMSPVPLEQVHTSGETEDSLRINTNYSKSVLNCEFESDITAKKKPHSCKYCGVAFTRAKALISHERLHQDYQTDFYECKKCGDVFLNRQYQKNHICKIEVSSKRNIISNVSHESEEPTSMQLESEKPPDLVQPTQYFEYYEGKHEETINNSLIKLKQNKHACQHCSKRFTTKQKMFRHMWIHRNKTFSCEICGETFSLQNQLDEHRLSSHPGNTPHGCPLCGKCFASRQGLWEHQRSHREGHALHHCNICGKHFASRQGFLIHTRTHTGERPYGCRYCWKAFRDGGTLRKHERIHTGERPHVCPLCRRAFNQKVVLREHVRWVHAQAVSAEPPLSCPLCPQLLTDKEDLCAHIVKHSDLLSTKDKQKIPSKSEKSKNPLLPKLTIKKDSFTVEAHSDPSESLYQPLMDSLPTEDSSDEAPSYSCDMCGDIFTSREFLLSHVKIHI